MLSRRLFEIDRLLALVALALAGATAACSKGDLAAAERPGMASSDSLSASAGMTSPPQISADSARLVGASVAPGQTAAAASIEEILKSSPLKNAKADCATPVAGDLKPTEVGTQCPTDPPVKSR